MTAIIDFEATQPWIADQYPDPRLFAFWAKSMVAFLLAMNHYPICCRLYAIQTHNMPVAHKTNRAL